MSSLNRLGSVFLCRIAIAQYFDFRKSCYSELESKMKMLQTTLFVERLRHSLSRGQQLAWTYGYTRGKVKVIEVASMAIKGLSSTSVLAMTIPQLISDQFKKTSYSEVCCKTQVMLMSESLWWTRARFADKWHCFTLSLPRLQTTVSVPLAQFVPVSPVSIRCFSVLGGKTWQTRFWTTGFVFEKPLAQRNEHKVCLFLVNFVIVQWDWFDTKQRH